MGNQLQPVSEVQPWHSYLKYRRLLRGFSLQNLANVTGLADSKLQKIESRTMVCPFVDSHKLAAVYAVFPEDLICTKTGLARTLREVEGEAGAENREAKESDSRKFLGRVNRQLFRLKIGFEQFAEALGYSRAELSDALYRQQLTAEDYIYQDVLTWLESKEADHG